jgi:hypothetical protein
MAFSNTQLDADLAVIVNDLPITVTVGTSSVTGTKMSLRRDALLADEGLRQIYRFSVYLRAASLTSVPTLRSTVTISGTSYRILNIVISDDARLYRLDLGEQYAAR